MSVLIALQLYRAKRRLKFALKRCGVERKAKSVLSSQSSACPLFSCEFQDTDYGKTFTTRFESFY